LNRYKYNKNYRPVAVCLAIALATIIWIAATAAVLFTSPSASLLGLNRTTATLTLFFVPSITVAALMLGINFWYTAEAKRRGWYGLSENISF